MTKIFISYRRSDTKMIVGRIFDRLKEKLGRDGVFMDIEQHASAESGDHG